MDVGVRLVVGARINADRGLRSADSVDSGEAKEFAVEFDGARGIVVTRYGKVDAIGVGVAIDNGDDGDREPCCLANSDGFAICIDNDDEVRGAAHIFDSAQASNEVFQLSFTDESFFFCKLRGTSFFSVGLQSSESVD